MVSPWAWVAFTVLAAGGQTLRNAMQRELTATLGTVGATHVRFLFGLPFGCLFLAVVLAVSGHAFPPLTTAALAWTTLGALAQIGATALLLAAMKERSFVVTTAYSKTEPVQVALFGLVFLGDALTAGLVVAIVIATAGVMVMSWPKGDAAADRALGPVLLGLGSASLFAIAAIGFRGGIRALELPNFVVAASTILVVGLIIQTTVLTTYLLILDRARLVAIFEAWRPSIVAGFMGAFASQMWFLAFALESAAKVRTLALIEIIFAQLISRNMFRQKLASREAIGIALIVGGVLLLLNLERLENMQ
jgi:drug/metabolite transporter (DMT)-like permease